MARAKSEATRERVIQGTLRALAQHGVTATTTRRIAAECDVPLATLHYHFESKSALLLAALDALNEEVVAQFRTEPRRGADLDGRIAQVLRAVWRHLERTRDLQIVQYELTMYALREDAGWLAERQYESYIQLYRDALFDTACRTGELGAAGCTLLARFMLAGIDGLLLQELARPSRARSRRGLEALIGATQGFARELRAEDRPAAAD